MPEPSIFEPSEPTSTLTPSTQPTQKPPYRSIMQVHNAFLVAETDEGLTIVDQHALHERVLYEMMSAQIAHGTLESQRLLIPETIDVTPRPGRAHRVARGSVDEVGVRTEPLRTEHDCRPCHPQPAQAGAGPRVPA